LKDIDNQEIPSGLHLTPDAKSRSMVGNEEVDAEPVSAERRMLESVSALIDGEANDLDLARALKAGDESEAMRAYWQRQQQYRAVMQSGGSAFSAVDVSSRVTAVISEDKPRFANPLVSMAVAASVTIAVVLGGQQALLFTDEPLQTVTAPGAVVQLPGTGAIQASFAQPTSPLPQPQAVSRTTNGADLTAEAAATRAFYNELAEERALSLGSVHQTTSADVSISPFIARLAEPKADQ